MRSGDTDGGTVRSDRDRFVNPYTFMPWPEGVVRRPAPGHAYGPDEASDRWCGTITVRWTLASPLLLPDAGRNIADWRQPDGRVHIPGASMKGAIRSLHEALFCGCLRVVDDDYTPAYREPARAAEHGSGWQLAIVTGSERGVPKQVARCDREYWLEATSLRNAYRQAGLTRLPTSGDVVDPTGMTLPDSPNSLGRFEVPLVPRVASSHPQSGADLPTGRIALLVTDVKARKKPGGCFWAAGRITDERLDVPPVVAETFAHAARGSRDRTVGNRDGDDTWKSSTQYEDVDWNGPVARRAKATGFLHKGDVVWAKLVDGAVVEIKLSQIWRSAATTKVGDRIPTSSKACKTPAALCLSCSIFGSADITGEARGRGDQDAYGAHVRIGHAMSIKPVDPVEVSLAPMGTPHPSAAPFYLDQPATLPRRAAGDTPSHWESEADEPRRYLRGRKFYWHGDPDAQTAHWTRETGRQVRPRHESRPHHSGEFIRPDARLVQTGTVFEQRIAVDGLDAMSVRTLLAAIDPARLLHLHPQAAGRRFGTHLGGGKPLGLGSVTATIETHLQPANRRYADATHVNSRWTIERGDLPDVVTRVGRLTRTWDSTIRILDLDGLGHWTHHLSYPPAATWDQIGTRKFDESYTFFRINSGEQLAGRARDWRPLPRANADDPTLPVAVDTRPDQAPGRGRR